MHYIYKLYTLLFLQQFTYSNKATTIKKNIKKKEKEKRNNNIYVYNLFNVCAILILL